MNLTLLDYGIIGVPLLVIVVFSLYMRRYMRSVADFLAASRCAGRYLICTASGATGASVMIMITALEMFSKTGFSLRFWDSLILVIFFFFGLVGLVGYRFRETRALTFHQFFELRYSRGVRVFASFLNVFSGVFNFGIQPAVGARFFVYFCDLPERCSIGGVVMPTFVPVLVVLMAVSVYFALTGGQISVMVTDCLEGVFSSIFYLVVAFFVVFSISVSQMREALLSGAPGDSFIDPLDIGNKSDFNGWFVIFGLLLNIYYYRGNAWIQGFAAAAKTAHEGRMSSILGNWRSQGSIAMTLLASIAAFTILHHPDFAAQQSVVESHLQQVGSSQLATQMRMPTALGVFLAPGVKGAFCAVLLFGLLAAQGVQLHGYGATILQDVIMPLRKKLFSPQSHMLALKLTVFCVAIFVSIFSILFKPVDYLVMLVTLIGSIYLGGVGLVCWGGLYWKKGTTAGAWTALIIGMVLGVGSNILQQFWGQINPLLAGLAGPGDWRQYLLAHADKLPLNGQQLSIITAGTAAAGYFIVSLLTCKQDFEMDRMLHRGRYRIPGEDIIVSAGANRSFLTRFLQIDEHFTRGDKVLTYGTFCWTVFWTAVSIGILLWTVLVGRLSPEWWFDYTMITSVWLTLVLGVITAVWFFIGASYDLVDLFRTLKIVKRSDADDGSVRDHHNAGEE
jgi:SSS family solute:Na+ symporter